AVVWARESVQMVGPGLRIRRLAPSGTPLYFRQQSVARLNRYQRPASTGRSMGQKVIPARDEEEDTADGNHPAEVDKERQKVVGWVEYAARQENHDISEVAECIGEVHEVADVPAIARHRDQPLEDSRVDGDVGQVQAQPMQHHERKWRHHT